jgi:hypothetical protein
MNKDELKYIDKELRKLEVSIRTSNIYLNLRKKLKSMIDDRPLTLEEAKEKGYYLHSYKNGDYSYKDENNVQYLIRDGKEICKGKSVFSYKNGDYIYVDKNSIEYLIRDGKEICKGKSVYSYNNGDYSYIDENGVEHDCKIINNEVWGRK